MSVRRVSRKEIAAYEMGVAEGKRAAEENRSAKPIPQPELETKAGEFLTVGLDTDPYALLREIMDRKLLDFAPALLLIRAKDVLRCRAQDWMEIDGGKFDKDKFFKEQAVQAMFDAGLGCKCVGVGDVASGGERNPGPRWDCDHVEDIAEVMSAVFDKGIDVERFRAAKIAGLAFDRQCACMVPSLEGAGQHAPNCAIFKETAKAIEKVWDAIQDGKAP